MTSIKRLFASTALILALLGPLEVLASSALTIETGYRYDRIALMREVIDTAFTTRMLTNGQNFQNAQSYQLGGRGWLQLPCIPLLVRGSGHYSWTFHGGYNQNYIVQDNFRGHAWDASVAIGPTFCICRCLEFVPLVGGSYDTQRYRISNFSVIIPPGSGDAAGDTTGTKWRSAWYGPYIGFDTYFRTCRCDFPKVLLNLGYEFHYGRAHLQFSPALPSPPSLFFHNTVTADQMFGHVFHLGALYPFCRYFLIGFNVQYSNWSNGHKSLVNTPPPAESGLLPTQFVRETVLNWQSLSVSLNLGICF